MVNEELLTDIEVACSFMAPFPGTYFYQHAAELGLRILTDKWEEFDAKHNILETKHLSALEIDDMVEEVVRETGLHRAAI
jgi:hypothetical protein